jgi:hypothetical protein
MKIRVVGVLAFVAVLLLLASALPVALAADRVNCTVPAKQLALRIDYVYAGQLGETDDQGRALVWTGTVQGAINGTMKWWFGPSPAPTTRYVDGRVVYYAARWEIWDAEGLKLLLAGESAGKTVTPGVPGAWKDGIWDGQGVVTQARGALWRLQGHHIYETGPVISDVDKKYWGTGLFVID